MAWNGGSMPLTAGIRILFRACPTKQSDKALITRLSMKFAHNASTAIPRGVTFSKALSELKAQISNASLFTETWQALSFETAFENDTK